MCSIKLLLRSLDAICHIIKAARKVSEDEINGLEKWVAVFSKEWRSVKPRYTLWFSIIVKAHVLEVHMVEMIRIWCTIGLLDEEAVERDHAYDAKLAVRTNTTDFKASQTTIQDTKIAVKHSAVAAVREKVANRSKRKFSSNTVELRRLAAVEASGKRLRRVTFPADGFLTNSI